MTTIAYRDGMVAADTGMSNNSSRHGNITKIARNERGDLAAGCGLATYCAAFLRWFRAGEQGEPPKALEDANNYDRGVIFRSAGGMEAFEPHGSYAFRATYFACGSGRPEALGAMWMGATAEQAVQAAMDLDACTHGPIETLTHAGN